MAILSQLEYRFNLFTDAVIQPLLTGVIEVTLWSAILASTATGTLAGYPRSSYLAYALWAAFFARISTNWMYEYRMMEEIDSGTVNSVLSRPISFYEYYLGQFMGYKLLTTVISFVIPIAVVLVIPGPTQLSRLPLACVLIFSENFKKDVASSFKLLFLMRLSCLRAFVWSDLNKLRLRDSSFSYF
jgi:ABC-2 type transport system permease protein